MRSASELGSCSVTEGPSPASPPRAAARAVGVGAFFSTDLGPGLESEAPATTSERESFVAGVPESAASAVSAAAGDNELALTRVTVTPLEEVELRPAWSKSFVKNMSAIFRRCLAESRLTAADGTGHKK